MRKRLVADNRAPSAARSYVASQLATRTAPAGIAVDDVVIIASELVTNAVRAGADWVDLTVRVTHQRLDLLVEDDAVGWPALAITDDEAVSGRGLHIVDELADAWLVTPLVRGKLITATWVAR